MSYRDELEAARERADALERELEEKERALAEKAKVIADRDKALAEKEQALAEVKAADEEEERDKAKAAAGAKKAREALDDLAAKAKQPKKVKPTPAVKAAPGRRPSTRLRLLRSVVWGGDFLCSSDALYTAPLVGIFLGFWVGVMALKLSGWIALPGAVLIPFTISFVLLPLYAMIKLGFLRRWPGTLSYQLNGYPGLLEMKPRYKEARSSYGDAFPDGYAPSFNPEGHTLLRLQLRFAKEPPADLATMLRGFDAKLGEEGDCSFSCESPVAENYSKSGSRRQNSDHNWKVHRWVRRCHKKLLRHLAAANGLISATISLH